MENTVQSSLTSLTTLKILIHSFFVNQTHCSYSYLTSRLIRIKRPLFYKKTITKRRLYIIYALTCFMTAMELGGCFLFLRKDFTPGQICITANILDNAVFFTMVLVNCLLLSLMMVVNFMWVTVQLRKEKIKAASFSTTKCLTMMN